MGEITGSGTKAVLIERKDLSRIKSMHSRQTTNLGGWALLKPRSLVHRSTRALA
jgi:hypothetical protein